MRLSRRGWVHAAKSLLASVCALLAWVACDDAPTAGPRQTPSAQAPSAAGPSVSIPELLRAEAGHRADWIPESAYSERDPALRGLVARAAARAYVPFDRAMRLLQDEEPVVVGWAAFGVSMSCPSDAAEKATRAVALAAARLASEGRLDEELAPGGTTVVDALASAFVGCGHVTGETSLRSWLAEPKLSNAAISALAWWAQRYRRLTDETIVELLNHAPAQPRALLPIAQLPGCAHAADSTCQAALNSTMSARLVEAAEAILEGKAGVDERVAALHAVSRGAERGGGVQQLLVGVTLGAGGTVPERVAAARSLLAMGAPDGTWRLVLRTLRDQLDEARAAKKPFPIGPVRVILDELPWSRDYEDELVRWAEAPTSDADAATSRRLSQVRCAAARILSHGKSLDPRLVACDVTEGEVWEALEVVRVLGEAPIVGARHQRWIEMLEHSDLRVRQAALELLGVRPEVRGAEKKLSESLLVDDVGTVAVAARAIRRRVHRDIFRADESSQKDLAENLTKALSRDLPPDATTTRVALLDLIGVTKLLSLRPAAEQACGAPLESVRSAAQRALRLLGTPNATCAPPRIDLEVASEVRTASRLDSVEVEIDFDSGKRALTLYPSLAPQAIARVKHLVETGFYAGQTVHLVDPGVVVQLGDPGGDGHGGAGEPPIPSESSPVRFRGGSVGLAQAGPDSGSSQIFVTLVEHPRLFGEYPWIGKAGPDWDTVVEGDRVLGARVVP